MRWANDDPNPVAIVGRKRDALDAAQAAALAAWDAMPPEEKKARLAVMHQSQARKITAVADRMPEPLLAAAEGGLLQGSSRMQFDEYRGIPNEPEQQEREQEQQLEKQDAAVRQQGQGYTTASNDEQQQVQVQHGYTNNSQQQDLQWSQYPSEYVEQAYYQQMEQQPERQAEHHAAEAAGGAAWYQGWRQRQKPDGLAAGAHTSTAGGQPSAATVIETGGEAAVLGLLADYGSQSDEPG